MSAKILLIGHGEETTWPRRLGQVLAPFGELELVTEALAFERTTQIQYDVILVDATAVADTVSVISRLRWQCPHARFVVVTASPTWRQARDAFHSGATDYIRKSLNRKEILTALKDVLSQPQPNSKI